MILGSSADVTWPNVLLLRLVVGLFILNAFVTLKASARNSILCLSRSWNVLERAISNCQVPGPAMLPAPTFPSVPVAGNANADGFRYFFTDLSPYGSAST